MFSSRTTARIAGALYFVTHVTSVGAVILYGASAYDSQSPLAGRSSVLIGALLEIVLAVGVVGTGIALLPLLRRYSSGVAAGYLALRTLEASVILTGVVVLLPVVAQPSLSTSPGLGSDAILSLRLIHDWTFLVGPGLIVPFHTVLLAWLLWRKGLVPRFIPVLGFIGGPLVGVPHVRRQPPDRGHCGAGLRVGGEPRGIPHHPRDPPAVGHLPVDAVAFGDSDIGDG